MQWITVQCGCMLHIFIQENHCNGTHHSWNAFKRCGINSRHDRPEWEGISGRRSWSPIEIINRSEFNFDCSVSSILIWAAASSSPVLNWATRSFASWEYTYMLAHRRSSLPRLQNNPCNDHLLLSCSWALSCMCVSLFPTIYLTVSGYDFYVGWSPTVAQFPFQYTHTEWSWLCMDDLGGIRVSRIRLYSRTFGPKHPTLVGVCSRSYVSFPYTVRLPGAIFSGQPWEYKRPRRPQINAQYQLSYLRLARFRTPDKSIQNVWRRGCCFGCWQWCVSLWIGSWRH